MGAQAVYGEIYKTYRTLGLEKSAPGYPTSSEVDAGSGYRASRFQRGAIFWSVKTGTITVAGDFYAEYLKRGGGNGFLMRPTAPERKLSGLIGGSAMDFEGGTITIRVIGNAGVGGALTKTVSLSFNFAQMKAALLSDARFATISAAALTEMRAFVSTASMPEHVAFLTRRVTGFHIENFRFRGAVSNTGNLEANEKSSALGTLVHKWFGGLDYPIAVQQPAASEANPVERRYRYAPTDGILFPTTGPASHEVVQGAIGDCYLLAALGALADLNKTYIQNMFIDNGDGTYTVRYFLDGVASYVTVDRFLPVNAAGRLVFSGSGRAADVPASLAS